MIWRRKSEAKELTLRKNKFPSKFFQSHFCDFCDCNWSCGFWSSREEEQGRRSLDFCCDREALLFLIREQVLGFCAGAVFFLLFFFLSFFLSCWQIC